MNKIIFADCSVTYCGRAKSNLDRGRYLIIIKNDNSVLIHGDSLITPINYLGTKSAIELDNNIIKCTKNNEEIIITIYSVLLQYEPKGWSSKRATLTGSEKELVEKFIPQINQVLGECQNVQINYPTDHGNIDIFCINNSKPAIIEAKRKKISLNVCWQLSRYMECIPDAVGYLLGPSISDNALARCKALGYKFIKYEDGEFSLT